MCLLKTREFNDHRESRPPISLYKVRLATEDDVTTAILFDNRRHAAFVFLQFSLIGDLKNIEETVGWHLQAPFIDYYFHIQRLGCALLEA
jgi:hypothetical protein